MTRPKRNRFPGNRAAAGRDVDDDTSRRLVKLGLTARVQGNGFVVTQDPPAGTALDTVAQCRLTLDRQRVARYDRAQP
jgi:hypothetical protein